MSEEEIINRFLNMIATEYDGGLARQFKNQYILKEKEIERQKEIIRQLDIKNLELTTIIKEVREYIKENTTSYYTDLEHTNEEFELIGDPKELLEILDKVDKEKNNEDN